jgi:hypothetical protein
MRASTLHNRAVRLVLAAMLLTTAVIAVSAPPARAATTDLLFSEYIEGSSNNKALEIYNGTGAPVDLAAGGYAVLMYFNGSVSADLTIALSGTVADGDVFVLANSAADAAILAQADQTQGSGWFNGDDAVVLMKGAAVVDSIGQVGFDPGSEWGTGLQSTADNTLRRMPAVCAGDTDPSDVFDPTVQWDGFAQNTVDGLGAHTAACGGGGTPQIVISEIMYNPASAEDDWEWIEIINVGDGIADLAGWVVDDNNTAAHGAANIATGVLPVGGSAILYNADDISGPDFAAAWGTGINLIAVTNWSAMALNNSGDRVGLWDDFASYTGDHATHANTVVDVDFDDSGPWPVDDGAASIYLTDLAADANDGANWALSVVSVATPVNTGLPERRPRRQQRRRRRLPRGRAPDRDRRPLRRLRRPGDLDLHHPGQRAHLAGGRQRPDHRGRRRRRLRRRRPARRGLRPGRGRRRRWRSPHVGGHLRVQGRSSDRSQPW